MKDRFKKGSMNRGGGDAVYGLGIIGSFVYFMQHSNTFWAVLVGIFKAVFWPAFVVHALLNFLHM